MIKYKGWVFNYDKFESPFKLRELFYNFVDFCIEVILLLPFVIFIILFFISYAINKNSKKLKKKFFLGSTPVITLKLLKELFDDEFDLTFFCYRDEYSILDSIEVKTIDHLSPIFKYKFTFKFWKYIAFLWALKNFDIFILYFDGGLLERSIFLWRLEPLIYKIFRKKIVMVPYGGDVWYICGDHNIFRSYTNSISRKRYFLLDIKRFKRIYLWSKYADVVISCIDYIRFVPRVDVITYGAQILNLDNYNYFFNDVNDSISIVHIANDMFRKGTFFINDKMRYIVDNNNNIEYHFFVGLKREKLYEIFRDTHIFIEQITYGFISYTSIEAMLTGKVVVLYLDDEINEFYKFIDYQFYAKFFEELPVVVVDKNNFINKIVELVKDKELIKKLSQKSREFAIRYVKNNIDAWRVILKSLESGKGINEIIKE